MALYFKLLFMFSLISTRRITIDPHVPSTELFVLCEQNGLPALTVMECTASANKSSTGKNTPIHDLN